MSTGVAAPAGDAPAVGAVASPRRARRLAGRALRVGLHLLAAVGGWSLLFPLVFETSRMASDSMAPLLRGTGPQGRDAPDTVLIETRFTTGAAPERFQVVAFMDDALDILVTKRVVAFAGETLVVTREGGLLVDGVAYPAPEGVGRGRGYIPTGNVARGKPFVVPAGHVYVLGDDSQDSYDSRFTGPLPLDHIRGRVLARVWPLHRLELL